MPRTLKRLAGFLGLQGNWNSSDLPLKLGEGLANPQLVTVDGAKPWVAAQGSEVMRFHSCRHEECSRSCNCRSS